MKDFRFLEYDNKRKNILCAHNTLAQVLLY